METIDIIKFNEDLVDDVVFERGKGGPGSGNWGHQGLDGVWGGSSPKRIGSTIAESDKYWEGSKADEIRKLFLSQAEKQDEVRDLFQKRVREATNAIFDAVERGELISEEDYELHKHSLSILHRVTRDDFETLAETLGVENKLDAKFDIWEVSKINGIFEESDKEWLRNHFGEEFNGRLEEFLEIVPEDVLQSGANKLIELGLKFGYKQTSYFPDTKKIIADPSDVPTFIESSIIHEFSHWLAHNSKRGKRAPFMQEKAIEFLKRRTAGEKERIIPTYGTNARFLMDKFHSPYVGRVYNVPNFTEVISMGFEYMYADPVGFARTDPDYFNFCIDLLIGDRK